MEQVFAFLQKIPPSRLIAMLGVAVFAAIFSIYMIDKLTAPRLSPIYTDLNGADSRRIVQFLQSNGIEHEIVNGGRTILAAEDSILQSRMQLAEQGLPSNAGLGYEIFDRNNSFGMTNFVQNINHLRALEGELARSISSLDSVRLARVHLVLPEKRLFQRDEVTPSASIMLKLNGSLSKNQIMAVRSLVSSAVRGLKPEKISIIDEYGNLLASGNGEDKNFGYSSILEQRNQIEHTLSERLKNILSSIVGPGNVKIQVAAKLNHTSLSETEEVYDPDGQVVRSSQNREEKNSATEANVDGAVTVGAELPDNVGDKEGASNRSNNQVTEETINYEITKKQRKRVIIPGEVQKLTVAVLVNGTYAKQDGQENPIYTPRSQEDIERIEKIVRTAIGINDERGDIVEVTSMQFNTPALMFDTLEEASMFSFTKNDYLYIAEIVILLICALILVLFIIRPLLKKALSNEIIAPVIANPENALLGGAAQGNMAALNDNTQTQLDQIADHTEEATEKNEILEKFRKDMERTKDLIDMAKASGEFQTESLNKVSEMVEENPEKAASVLRDWMQEAR